MRVFVVTGLAHPQTIGSLRAVLGVYSTRELAEKDIIWYENNGYSEVHIDERPLIEKKST